MNDLRKIVYDILLKVPSVTNNVYFMKAPMDASLPYIVFTFPSEGRTHKGQEEIVLEVNVYDCERGEYNVANQIERLTDNINFELDYKTGETENHADETAYWFRKTSRIAVPYPQDSNMWRRELRYNVKKYSI